MRAPGVAALDYMYVYMQPTYPTIVSFEKRRREIRKTNWRNGIKTRLGLLLEECRAELSAQATAFNPKKASLSWQRVAVDQGGEPQHRMNKETRADAPTYSSRRPGRDPM